MFHFFTIDELRLAVDADYLIRVSDDDGDGNPDIGVLEWARQVAEDEVIAYVEAAPAGYDADDWQVDDDEDGISDNINGLVKSLAIDVALFKLASRRTEIPDNIQRKYDIADLKLQRIQAGTLLLINDSGSRTISHNMVEDDLGQLTQDGEELPWAAMP